MDRPIETVQSSQALSLGLSLDESFRGVEENPSGFMQKPRESRAVGRRAQPVKLAEDPMKMLG